MEPLKRLQDRLAGAAQNYSFWSVRRRWPPVLSYRVGRVEAGHRAGCRAIFVDYGYSEQRPDGPYVGVRSLRDAAQWILRTTRPGHQMDTSQYA